MKKRKIKKIFGGIDVSVKVLMFVFVALFATCIFFKSKLLFAPASLISVCLILGFVNIAKYETKHYKAWLIAIFVIAFLSRLAFIKIWPVTPVSECEAGYRLAQQLNNASIRNWHEIFAANEIYYDVWPMRVPFVVFEALCLRFFGGSILSISIVNSIFSALTCVLVAMCVKSLSGSRRAAIIGGLTMAFNMTTLFMASALVNKHISACLFVASMCFIIKKPFKSDLVNYTVAGAFLGLAHLMSPEMQIVIIALWCVLIYKITKYFKYNKKKVILAHGKKAVLFTLAFLLVVNIANFALLGVRWVNSPITESRLPYKVMVGLNYETGGGISDEDLRLAGNDLAVKEVLQERFSMSVKTLELIVKKVCFQFSSHNYRWLEENEEGALRQFATKNILGPLTQGYMFCVMVLAFVAMIKVRKKIDNRIILLYTVFIGFVFALALTEVHQGYDYITIPVLTILSSLAFDKKVRRKHSSGHKV